MQLGSSGDEPRHRPRARHRHAVVGDARRGDGHVRSGRRHCSCSRSCGAAGRTTCRTTTAGRTWSSSAAAWSAPIVVLAMLFGFVIRVMPADVGSARLDHALTVEVIGHQWCWEVRYPGTDAVTANEIHIPVRHAASTSSRTTADVIHSFWVPRAEPQDRHDPRAARNRIAARRPTRPGATAASAPSSAGSSTRTWRSRSSREPPAAFRALARRRRRAPAARRRRRRRAPGEQRLPDRRVRGAATRSAARRRAGDVGPDLTHLAARARRSPRSRSRTRPPTLRRLDRDPQHVKPGQPDARTSASPRRRSTRARRLPGEPALMAVEPPPAAAERDRAPRADLGASARACSAG